MCFSNKDNQDDIEPPRPAPVTDNQQPPSSSVPVEPDDSDLTHIIGHYIRYPDTTVSDRPDLKKLRLYILQSLTMAIIMRRKLGHNDIEISLKEILKLLYRKSEIAEATQRLEEAFQYGYGQGKYDEDTMRRESMLLYGAEAAGCLYQYKPDMASRVREVVERMWIVDMMGDEGRGRLERVDE